MTNELSEKQFEVLKKVTINFTDKLVKTEMETIRKDTIVVMRAEARSILRTILTEEFDIKKMVGEQITNLSKDGFKPVVSAIYNQIFSKVTGRLTNALTSKISLKTSDMMILNDEIRMVKYDMGQLRRRGLTIYKGELMEISKANELKQLSYKEAKE